MMKKKKKNPSSKSKDECKNMEMDKIVVKSKVNHISDDMIREILFRLPPISVLRFKYVCKTWYSLITNPDFLRTHSSSLQFYKHTTTTVDEELMVSSYFSKIIPLEEHPLLKQGELLDCYVTNSCNGLLLLRKISNSSSYYVCNPIIKHYFKIPNISITENIFKVFIYPYILFDPSTSLSYKLIRYCIDEKGDILFHVYSSEIGSWRRLISFPSQSMNYETVVLLNGISYWKVYNGDHLLCFDLKKENVWFLPLPPKPMGYSKRNCFYFGHCDGRLRLIEKYFDSHMSQLTFPCSFDIMETEPQQQHNGNLTWSVEYHVNIKTGYEQLIENHPSTFRIVLLFKTKNEGEEEALLLNIHGKIVPFNLKSNTFGKVQNTRHSSPWSDFTNTFPCIKTLLPLL